MTPEQEEYWTPERRANFEKNLAEINERAARNRTLLPSGRAIVFTWLLLLVIIMPFWGR
ncbi:hypothetical protein [Sinomonas mesophila]|uniref:hypothetical protein n=1 Tax=Sinomonas mesophila TaxID=1531955 RepID=UPI00158ACCC9|nr:hypothetical protein [Sinomonas mesophila]